MARKELTRRELLKAAAAGAATVGGAALLAACQPSTPKGASGTLTVGLSGQSFASMDVLHTAVTESHSIYDAMFEKLVNIDFKERGKAQPLLATSWKQVDPVTWDFTIRQGVTFHNGEALDAESAQFSLQSVMDDPKTYLQSRLANVASVRVIDPRTLRVVTKTPDVLTVENVGEIHIYPKKYYTTVGPDEFKRKPVGTGQWKFESWPDGVNVNLVPFEKYWDQPAKLQRIIYKPIPETSTRLAALLAGEIDLAYGLNLDDTPVLKNKGFVAASTSVAQGTGIHFTFLGNRPKGSPVENKLVRQALNYAIDKDAIVKDILLGTTRALQGQLVGPNCFGFNPSLQPYPYDPNKAKQLLAEAGYPNGFTINFESSAANYTKGQEVSENLVAQLAKVGVKVNLTMLEWNNYIQKIFVDLNSAPLTYIGWNWAPIMDANYAVQWFLSSSQFKLFANPEMDRLYALESSEFDRTKREQILWEFMKVMREEAPFLFCFESPLVYGVNPRVVGFEATPDDRPRVKGISLKA